MDQKSFLAKKQPSIKDWLCLEQDTIFGSKGVNGNLLIGNATSNAIHKDRTAFNNANAQIMPIYVYQCNMKLFALTQVFRLFLINSLEKQ